MYILFFYQKVYVLKLWSRRRRHRWDRRSRRDRRCRRDTTTATGTTATGTTATGTTRIAATDDNGSIRVGSTVTTKPSSISTKPSPNWDYNWR